MRVLVGAWSWRGVAHALELRREGFAVTQADTPDDLLLLADGGGADAVLLWSDVPGTAAAGLVAPLAGRRPVLVLGCPGDGDEGAACYAAGAFAVLDRAGAAEVAARLRAAVMRRAGHTPPRIAFGGLVIDVMARTVTIPAGKVPLSPLQYQMVERLALASGTVVSRDALLDHLYGGEQEPSHRVLDTFLHDVRRRICAAGGQGSLIETVRGQGFRLARTTTPDLSLLAG
ncbi:winged-helix domain-containing protein [Pelagovum pacificum]|uniref:Response regulator transcription factor n=1 Tax=Pelagovum pacificum TaxID=2588711 RepID=A0A5C5GEF2_9RHOB|nr:response regulator transcription factor [Pelagovum pacificum]QQA43778.1 response regulator transcription factor [Pelagovum pacificum]TNY33093.1 response regulator transcription factor [Pelagovum pacificum]